MCNYTKCKLIAKKGLKSCFCFGTYVIILKTVLIINRTGIGVPETDI